jgi:hypothetical protein
MPDEGTPVYLSAVVESLAAHILATAGNCAQAEKDTRITPRHIKNAFVNNEELSKLHQTMYPNVYPVCYNFRSFRNLHP